MSEKQDVTCKEAGRRGGKTTSERHGPAHYSELGHRGGNANVERHNPEHFREIGRRGGKANAEKRGSEYMRELGRRGGNRVKELIAAGKAAQAADVRENVEAGPDGHQDAPHGHSRGEVQ